MTLKRFISACTPSYFVDAVRARRLKEEKETEDRLEAERLAREKAEREASSWEDACNRAGSYEAETLTKFRVARSALRAADGSVLKNNILGLVARIVGKSNVAITDFGGSTGELGDDFILAYPDASYCVVETPALAALKQAASPRPGLRFVSEMPPACDIFYSSGTFQYLSDPMASLVLGMKSTSSAVVLKRNYFSDAPLFDIQKSRLFENGDGKVPDGFSDFELTYPRQSMVEADVHALAIEQGFECIANVDDYAPIGGRGYSRQLVFMRI